MIISPDLYKKATGQNFDDDFCFNYPEHAPPLIRLLKEETALPLNILDVTYSVSLEWGEWQLIKFQNNTADEIDETAFFKLYFDEDAAVFHTGAMDDVLIGEDDFHAVQDFVKKSASDEKSALSVLMKERAAQWEQAVKKTDEKNLEKRQKG